MSTFTLYPSLIIAFEDRLTAELIATLKTEIYFEVSHFSENTNELLDDLLIYKPDFLLVDPNILSTIGKNLFSYIKDNQLPTRLIVYSKDSLTLRNCLGKSLSSITSIIYHGVSKKEFVLYLQLIFLGKIIVSSDYSIGINSDAIRRKKVIKEDSSSLLSDREIEIWFLLLEAKTENEIATNLNISVFTVRKHKSNITLKLGIKNKRRLTSFVLDYIRGNKMICN